MYKINGDTAEIEWHIAADQGDYLSIDISITDNYIVKLYIGLSDTIDKVVLHDANTGEFFVEYNVLGYDFSWAELGKWLYFDDKQCYYNSVTIGDSEIIAFDVQGGDICNPKTIYKYGESEEYHFSEVKCAKAIDNDFIALNVYSDSVITEQAAVYVYDKSNALLKWKYEIGKIKGKGAWIGKLYAKNTKNFDDLIFAVIGRSVVLLDEKNGGLVHEYKLKDSAIGMYYSKNGIVYVLTAAGEEIAIPIRNMKKADFGNENYIGMYKTHQFLSKPQNATYANGNYSIYSDNANDIFVYRDMVNKDFTQIYQNDINSSNCDVDVNKSGSYAIINTYEALYVYDNAESKKLDDFHIIRSYSFVQDNILAVLFSDENYDTYLNFYNLNNCSLTNSIKVENVISDDELIVMENTVVIHEFHKVSFIAPDGEIKEWTPKKKTDSPYKELSEGYIKNVDVISDNMLLAYVDYYGDGGKRLELYDYIHNDTIILEEGVSQQGKYIRTVLLSDNIVAACIDNTICCFDLTTGKKLSEYRGDIANIISIFNVSDKNHIGVLCADAKVHKINLDLAYIVKTIDMENDTMKTATRDYCKYEYIVDENLMVLNWTSDNSAYFIDLEDFDIRYDIKNYYDYCADKKTIYTNEYSIAGYYPLYSTKQLIDKANKYMLISSK